MNDPIRPGAGLSRRHWLKLAPALAASPLAAAAEPGVGAAEVLIGQSITLQGGRNDYGVSVMDGVKACIDQANADGGVHRRRIVLQTLDDDNDTARAEANARKLVTDSGAFLLFGSIEGGPSTAVMKAAVELNVPFFGPMAGSPGLRRPLQPLVFPVRAEHREEFRALMQYGRERGMTRVAFLHSDSDVGRAHLANVRLLANALAMEVVAPVSIPSSIDDAQADAIVRQLLPLQPQLMFNHGSAGAYERIIRKARGAGSNIAFMAICSGSTQLADKLGPLAVGMVFTQVVPSPTSRATQLSREYQQSFRRAWPDKPFTYGSLEGWFTASSLVAALQAAGPALTRQRLVSALHAAPLRVSGMALQYSAAEHRGSTFVDLAMYSREQRFLH
ncbi:MAG: ABC transporter substrate-binding protein [Burkholderiaceae bacterium]